MATSPEVAASLSCEISHQILDSQLLKIHLLVVFCIQQYWIFLHTVVPALSKDYNQECHLRLTK